MEIVHIALEIFHVGEHWIEIYEWELTEVCWRGGRRCCE